MKIICSRGHKLHAIKTKEVHPLKLLILLVIKFEQDLQDTQCFISEVINHTCPIVSRCVRQQHWTKVVYENVSLSRRVFSSYCVF
jgi:hypothetical protein